MTRGSVTLTVPAEASFARMVRMCAANVAVLANMNIEQVDDLRMAAEEGFVLACATRPEACSIDFSLSQDEVRLSYSLGDGNLDEAVSAENLDLARILLGLVCDSQELTSSTLTLVKSIGGPDAG